MCRSSLTNANVALQANKKRADCESIKPPPVFKKKMFIAFYGGLTSF